MAPQSVESMTLSTPCTVEPAAVVGDSVAVSVPVAPGASFIGVTALPPEFAFVIKKEMVRVPLAGLLLRRLGSQFVERFDRHKGGVDARREGG